MDGTAGDSSLSKAASTLRFSVCYPVVENMEHLFGLNEYLYRQQQKEQPVVWRPADLINAHILVTGMSGVGKSFQLRTLARSAAAQGVEVDIFDVHDELAIPEASVARFSEATGYGYNPLVLNPDPHSGGVRKRINELVKLVGGQRALGVKQEAALRNLLEDVYFLNGCYADNPGSWAKKQIDESRRRELVRSRRYDELRQYYPTVEDLLSYADRKLKALFLGSDSKAVTALDAVNRQAAAIQRLTNRYQRPGNSDEDRERLERQLDQAKENAVDAFARYVRSIESGRELSDVLKYSSRDVLQSVVERLKNLNASGIFRANPPPFGDAPVRCYQIKSLSLDEQRVFVASRLESMFRRRKDAGTVDRVVQAALIDEAHKFIDDDPDNPVNVVLKEGRKFGLAIWAASQSPTHFSEDFLANVGTTLLLGIHPMYWDMACRKLRIEPKVLKFIRPRKVAAIKMQGIGTTEPRFQNVMVSGT